ncbi:MAG: DMT family transporter [Rhodobacteraceae bacterium]|nr:DMT family transporter [Paracoccaceae bacterium]
MLKTLSANPARLGAFCAAVAVAFFAINDTTIKFLSGDYALHEVVLFRSVLGLIVASVIVFPFAGGWQVLKTQRLVLHILRGLLVVAANIFFFLGLAALPLADAVAIFFVSPLLITVFSVVFLGEYVGPRRWAAVAIGFVGVLIVQRPGTEAFQVASLLPVLAAACYAGLHMMTRFIGKTESAATMTVYIQLTFIVICVGFGLVVGDGRFAEQENPSLAFLFRAWVWPEVADLWLFLMIGFATGLGGFFISQAYRVAEPAVVAPFEYLALPIAVVAGYFVFGEVPDRATFAGIALILGAGLFIIWREARADQMVDVPRARR